MSEILDEVEAENLEKIRNEQKVVVKMFIKERDDLKKVLETRKKDLNEVTEKIVEVSNMNEETFKTSKFYGSENLFLKVWNWETAIHST